MINFNFITYIKELKKKRFTITLPIIVSGIFLCVFLEKKYHVFFPKKNDNILKENRKDSFSLISIKNITLIEAQKEMKVIGKIFLFNTKLVPEMRGGVVEKVNYNNYSSLKEGSSFYNTKIDIIDEKIKQIKNEIEIEKIKMEKANFLFDNDVGNEIDTKITKERFDSLVSKLTEKELEKSKLNMSVPFSGRVEINSHIHKGTNINNLSQDQIPSLYDSSETYVDFFLNVSEIKDNIFNVFDRNISITIEGYNDRFIGRILLSDSVINSSSNSVKVRGKVYNNGKYLLPQSNVNIILKFHEKHKEAKIPESAIFEDGVGGFVYILLDGRVVKKEISILNKYSKGEFGVIGLDENDQLIVSHLSSIRIGQKIPEGRILFENKIKEEEVPISMLLREAIIKKENISEKQKTEINKQIDEIYKETQKDNIEKIQDNIEKNIDTIENSNIKKGE
jgi:hypothetical protein